MKTYNIIKQAVVDNHVTIAADVTVNGSSILGALESIKANAPRMFRQARGISMWKDADGWLYLVNIN